MYDSSSQLLHILTSDFIDLSVVYITLGLTQMEKSSLSNQMITCVIAGTSSERVHVRHLQECGTELLSKVAA
jgi:hypothetical protein